MTLDMPDSVDVSALPDGYGQYLGYVDGSLVKPTMPGIRARFPRARLIGLTVTGATLDADGIDCEPGNVNAADTRVWVQKKLAAHPGSRPVVYASVLGAPNFGMAAVIRNLVRNGITRDQVRLLSAHWGRGKHICGPDSCGAATIPMDGTQWTDTFPGHGALIDMSVLEDSFFGSQTEEIVRELPVVRQGDSGAAVRTVQGLVNARRVPGETPLVIDGHFGPLTAAAVRTEQQDGEITVDGIVGPQTWPVLLGIA